MKKIITTIVAAVAFVGLFAENTDGSMPVPWTAGCIVVLAVCARILEHQFAGESKRRT